jgi:hypothetical protein
MARKLKTYQTSLGFFDQAIAAPSMKGALEAWGADSNLFHQGAAKESDDPDVVAATMAKPGIVLKRPVGSDVPFRENAELPIGLGDTDKPTKTVRKPEGRKTKKPSYRPVDEAAERKAADAHEREPKSRNREQAKEEAARQKERERRQEAVTEAQTAFDAPSEPMRRGPGPSRPRRTLLRRKRKPKMPGGKVRSSGWTCP